MRPVWADGPLTRNTPAGTPAAQAAADHTPVEASLAPSLLPLAPHARVTEWGPGHVRILYELDTDALAAALATAATSPGTPTTVLLQNLITGGWVGVPLSGPVELEILAARQVGHLSLAQAAEAATDLHLEAPAILGEPGFLRDQRVVQVKFGPASEGAGRVAVYDRVEVQLLFEPQSTSADRRSRASRDRFAEGLYAASLLNYDQAKAWRQPRPRAAARPVQGQASQGQRLKLIVRTAGMHRISGDDLAEAGVRLQDIRPDHLRLLYGGGKTLGRSSQVSPGVHLFELPIVVEDGGDDRFDRSDYILFYGEPPTRWEYRAADQSYVHILNPYTGDNVYWLALDGDSQGMRAAARDGSLSESQPLRPNRYRERLHLEDEQYILRQLEGINTGYDWYWDNFQGNARNFSTVIRDAVDDPVDVRLQIWGWTDAGHQFVFRWNDADIGTRILTSRSTNEVKVMAPMGPVEGLNQLGIFHRGSQQARLDWIELEYSRRLVARGDELCLDWGDAVTAEDGSLDRGVAAFQLRGFAGDRPRVFDISEGLAEIVGGVHDPVSGTLEFQDDYDGRGPPPRYVAAAPSRWRRPDQISRDASTHLRSEANGAEYIIITHSEFHDAAERLAAWRARDHRLGEPLSTAVVDVADVYDEFSGGLLDPMAIRSFIHFALNHWDPAPFFILLVGDGTYDYKNNSGTSHTNWMPAFQDGISMYDEWYVRVEGTDVLPDLAIGRLPVQTAAAADGVVDKLISYDREPETGPWRARNLLIADDPQNPQHLDEDGSFFLRDAEDMAYWLLPQDLDLVKLYLAQYPLEGEVKPRARDEFVRRFNEGALLITYLGHGGPETLAHEQMFVLSRDFAAIDNGHRWPFMYTVTCQVGAFDDPTRQSMPEALLNAPDRGVIGFIAATRLGYHHSNLALVRKFYELMFQSGDRHVPVGLALTVAKQLVDVQESGTKGRVNVQRYSLLGDPAMRLARPLLSVELDLPDTLRALEEVHMTGLIVDADHRMIGDYDGTAWVRVFDSAAASSLEGQTYEQLGAPVFRCLTRVARGRFEATFRMPKDITYRAWQGRASAYAWRDGADTGMGDESAFGSVNRLVVAGTAQNVEPDEAGPIISLGFRGQSEVRSGDLVLAHPILETVIADPSGINITGETGHQIVLQLDGERVDVTDFYSNRDGDYRSGVLDYDLGLLEPGDHTLSVKAWDTFNNSSFAEVRIHVAEEGIGRLTGVLFHPNPLHQGPGSFTYTLAEPAEAVNIRVYTMAGRLVEEIIGGYRMGYNQVTWTPRHPLANAPYPYCVTATFGNGLETTARSVLQVLR